MSKSMTYRDALEFASRLVPSEHVAQDLSSEATKTELVNMLFDYADKIWEEFYARYPEMNE
ncbi:MAG: hypothetical protein HXM21_00350 [Haemophilus influenzae]|nr:hypothetical protein [Haemophilus influenzae]